MYKKMMILWFMILWCFYINYWYAQEYTPADLDDITVRFCDKPWESIFKKTIYVEPWKDSKVGICIYNKNPIKKIPINYGFTTAVYNSSQTRVCDATTDFTLIPKTKKRTIFIGPLESVMVEENIVIPPGINSGLQMWCLTAEIWGNPTIDMGGVFLLTVRKTFDLNIIVWWAATIKNSIKIINNTWWTYSTDKRVSVFINSENKARIWFKIENDGNIPQSIIITWKIYNALGFEKEFSINNKIIVPKAINEFITNEEITIPFYKWLFSVKFAIQNDPQFSFDVQNKEMSKSWYIIWKANIFIFSWILVIIVILILLFIYKIIAPRKVK